MDSPLVDPEIRVHPKRCAHGIRASKDHGWDYRKGVGKRTRVKRGWTGGERRGGERERGARSLLERSTRRRVRAWERSRRLVEMGGCADFMMFFDATARPARARGKRWSGNELESAELPIRFSDLVMERTQKRAARWAPHRTEGRITCYSRRTPAVL